MRCDAPRAAYNPGVWQCSVEGPKSLPVVQARATTEKLNPTFLVKTCRIASALFLHAKRLTAVISQLWQNVRAHIHLLVCKLQEGLRYRTNSSRPQASFKDISHANASRCGEAPQASCTRHRCADVANTVANTVAHAQYLFPITEILGDDPADHRHDCPCKYLYWNGSSFFEFRKSFY
jgi:hypothetical protein